MVDQDPEPPTRPGPKSATTPARSSIPPRYSTTIALDPQVVAPDPLDQFGVVATLDVDPARRSHFRGRMRDRP